MWLALGDQGEGRQLFLPLVSAIDLQAPFGTFSFFSSPFRWHSLNFHSPFTHFPTSSFVFPNTLCIA